MCIRDRVYVVGQGASILLFGKMYRFTQKLSLTMFLQFLVSTLCVGAALLLIQQMLSLLSNNQIIPLIVGIGGSFLGLFSMFFPENVTRLVVWAYFSVFSTVAMDWDRSLRIVDVYKRQPLCVRHNGSTPPPASCHSSHSL